jgi:hypothetical protein
MNRFFVRAAALAIALATLAAVQATAQVVKKGVDYWVTPNNSMTKFKFKEGDVETLCKVRPDPKWNHQVILRGVRTQGSDWDSAVARLANAKFNPAGTASTPVQFKSLALASTTASDTPCGKLDWSVRLARGVQPITKMKITKTSKRGGTFFVNLALRVEMRAVKADTGAYVGSLFYDVKLKDPPGGTPWSFSPTNVFRPGMNDNDDCIDVLREKLGQFDPDSDHFYYISQLIANKDCGRK